MLKTIDTILKSVITLGVMSDTSVATIISVNRDAMVTSASSSLEPATLEGSTSIFAFKGQAHTLYFNAKKDTIYSRLKRTSTKLMLT